MTVAAVESIPCPRCGAAPGQTCRTPGGLEIPTGHASRWLALFTGEPPLDTRA